MNKINQFARRVAAVDEKMIERCPNKDKIWATQIGYALMLTFVVLFGISFYSMTIMHGGDILFDVETKSIKFDTQVITIGEYVTYVIVGMVAALIVTLFDRTFYQSDWFMQAPYGVEIGFMKRVGFWMGKALNMVVRIAISLFLAYTFSSFLELKVYESELLTSMQKKHYEQNRELYADMEGYADTLDEKENRLKQQEEVLTGKIRKLESGVIVWTDDKTVLSYKKEAAALQQHYAQMVDQVEKKYENQKSNIRDQKEPYEKQLKQQQKQYNDLELKYQAEVGGLKEIEIDGKVIKASGIPTEGRRARLYKSRMKQLQKEMKPIQEKVVKYEQQLKGIEAEKKQEKKKIEKAFNAEEKKVEQALVAYQKKAQKGSLANAQTIKQKYKAELKRVQDEIEDLHKNKQHYVEVHYKEVMQSPKFIPFRDGPMSRLVAMEELKKDPELGKEIAISSWFVKGILIFLEVAPILAKMLFGPPTLYATALQVQTKRMTQQVMEEEGLDTDTIDELIALEKKKRELLKERQNTAMARFFDDKNHTNLNDVMHQHYSTQAA